MRGNGVSCAEVQDSVPTHELTPAGPIPTAFDPNGVYPYLSYVATSPRPVPRTYRFIVLENERIKAVICPDLGGKVTSLVHKGSGREVLYRPAVIKPVRILPRFYFVAGGIEVSFPISHSPSQNEPVVSRVDHAPERVYVTCGERELRFGMHWSVEYSLGPGDEFLTQRTVFHNPGRAAYPWMSWSNAAVPSALDTEFHFPRGRVLRHSSRLETIDWHESGPRRESDIEEMTGYFWQTSDANAFGAFTPSLGTGLYHVADEKLAPGMKLWSYGVGQDRDWATLGPYIEIQGGPIRDQATKLLMQPGETRWHVEYWLPSAKPLDIHALKVPTVSLRPVSDVPRFDWARQRDVQVWIDLVSAYERKGRLPELPEPKECLWAPSGMEELDRAFEWAIGKEAGGAADGWRFHFGTWLAGRGEAEAAIRVLSASNLGVAQALLARLLRLQGDLRGAAQALGSIREPWLELHSQIMVERDEVLRGLGRAMLARREQWLSRVGAPPDEWIAERRVQLLIDMGELEKAKQLLLSTSFQRVHQRYVRTELWNQICQQLNEPCAPVPRELGEDRLARFGAYREFA